MAYIFRGDEGVKRPIVVIVHTLLGLELKIEAWYGVSEKVKSLLEAGRLQ